MMTYQYDRAFIRSAFISSILHQYRRPMIVLLLMFIGGSINLALGKMDNLNWICLALPLMYFLVLLRSLRVSYKTSNELVDKSCSLKLENGLMEFRSQGKVTVINCVMLKRVSISGRFLTLEFFGSPIPVVIPRNEPGLERELISLSAVRNQTIAKSR